MSNKEKTLKKNLIEVDGTVANVVANNMDYINELCISKKSLDEVKAGLVELLETNAKKTARRDDIIRNIKKQPNKYKAFQYICDCMLAGAGDAVIKVS